MNDDIISRSALKEAIIEWFNLNDVHDQYWWNRVNTIIDNAPTIDTTCPNCDSSYAQGYSDGYLKGKEEKDKIDTEHSVLLC